MYCNIKHEMPIPDIKLMLCYSTKIKAKIVNPVIGIFLLKK